MRALVTAGQGVGNVIMATPVIAAVAALGFETDVLLAANYPGTAELLDGWEEIHEVHTRRPHRRYAAVVRTVWHRAERLHLGPEFHPGDGDPRQTHEVVANLAGARALGFAGEIPAAHCQQELPPGVTLPERYAVIASGYGGWASDFWERKRWPHWEAFCARVLRDSELDLVALGTANEWCDWPGSKWGPFVNLCGRTTLRQAAGVMARAAFVVAIDNGLAHMAAAVGAPVFVLFGATSEVKNRPWGRDVTVLTADRPCRPCQMTERWQACDDWRCMADLHPDAVWEAVQASGRVDGLQQPGGREQAP